MIQFLHDLFATLLRLLLLAGGFVVGAVVLLTALTAGAGVLAWSLLTGRKPVLRFRMDPRATMAGMRARAQRPASRPAAPMEVIDIEAREVPDRRD